MLEFKAQHYFLFFSNMLSFEWYVTKDKDAVPFDVLYYDDFLWKS